MPAQYEASGTPSYTVWFSVVRCQDCPAARSLFYEIAMKKNFGAYEILIGSSLLTAIFLFAYISRASGIQKRSFYRRRQLTVPTWLKFINAKFSECYTSPSSPQIISRWLPYSFFLISDVCIIHTIKGLIILELVFKSSSSTVYINKRDNGDSIGTKKSKICVIIKWRIIQEQ